MNMKRHVTAVLYLLCLVLGFFVLFNFYKPESEPQYVEKMEKGSTAEESMPKEYPDSIMKTVIQNVKKLNQPILVTVINDAYIPFAHNWLCNTLYMDIHKQVLVIATDKKSRDEVAQMWPEVNVIALPGDGFHGNQDYSRAGYVRIMVKRTEFILQILKEEVEMLLFDLDTFWKTDPLPECRRQVEGFDIAAIPVSNRPGVYCGGFIYMKPTVNMVKLWSKLTDMMLSLDKKIKVLDDNKPISEADNDQAYISVLLQKKYADIKLKELSLKTFPDGQWYKLSQSDRENSPAFVVHNNWIVGNKAKIERAKKFHQWFWDPDSRKCNKDLVILTTAN